MLNNVLQPIQQMTTFITATYKHSIHKPIKTILYSIIIRIGVYGLWLGHLFMPGPCKVTYETRQQRLESMYTVRCGASWSQAFSRGMN